MIDFNFKMSDGAVLGRLGRMESDLQMGVAVAEGKINEKTTLEEGEGMFSDADESLAMALGKNVQRKRKQDKLVRTELSKALDEL